MLEQKRIEARERERERELEFEKLKQENELQREKLKLIAEGKLRGDGAFGAVGVSQAEGNLSHMIRFLPKFTERDPDIFFSLFEDLANEHTVVPS